MSEGNHHTSRRRDSEPDVAAYNRLAEVYDLLGFHTFTRLALAKCRDYLADSELVVHRLLDLACGTGHFAIEMARKGIDVTGVDAAPAMLTRARANAKRLRRSPRWIRGRFTGFTAPGKYDLITCWFDSLNHLHTDAQLVACFRRVRRHLTTAGAFIFDVNTPQAFRRVWTGSSYQSTPRYCVHRQGMTEPGGEFGAYEIEVFVRRGATYRRLQLPFRQRGLEAAQLRRLLRQAGFSRIDISAFDARESRAAATRLFVAVEP
jgi:SAM-dependent methyltransferase